MEEIIRRKKKKVVILAAVIISITAALIFTFTRERSFVYSFNERFVPDEPEEVVELEFRNPLTGEAVSEEMDLPQVYSVMVENMVEAWPLAGIEEAFLVIEAPVEAAIPRFIAFFSEDRRVDKIGPVRSARPYYLDWAEEFGALYAHVGGSPEALDLIDQKSLLDLNEFYNGWYFWRDQSRYAPHNVYTSMELLNEALEDMDKRWGVGEPDYELWKFKEDAEDRPESAAFVSMVFSPVYGTLYEAGWKYDPQTNTYVRYQDGSVQRTEDGALIRANNVAIIETDIIVLDEVGRRRISTLGEGDAFLLQDGEVLELGWEKPSGQARLRFVKIETGEEVAFNAGVTWIEVLPSLDRVTFDGYSDLN